MTWTFSHANSACVSWPDLLPPLSTALDVAAGRRGGHAVRACVIAMRIGYALGYNDSKLVQLYCSALLKDAGATNAAPRMARLFGFDETEAKRAYLLVDWSNPIDAAKFAVRYMRGDESLFGRAMTILRSYGDHNGITAAISHDRAVASAMVAKDLGFGTRVHAVLRGIDEYYDGSGSPDGLIGTAIPQAARIISVAQALDSFLAEGDLTSAYKALDQQSERRFDPEIVGIVKDFEEDRPFWSKLAERARQALESYELALPFKSLPQIDSLCVAFGRIADAKSAYTREHSRRVCAYADAIGRHLDLGAEKLKIVQRAALLHDIGKLAVPNNILDKPGELTPEEWARLKKYPQRTEQLLAPLRGFRRIASVASSHMERLDGRGYHRGLRAENMDIDMRIVAVADSFDALISDRPQRSAMTVDQAFRVLEGEARTGFDVRCVAILKQQFRHSAIPQPPIFTAVNYELAEIS